MAKTAMKTPLASPTTASIRSPLSPRKNNHRKDSASLPPLPSLHLHSRGQEQRSRPSDPSCFPLFHEKSLLMRPSIDSFGPPPPLGNYPLKPPASYGYQSFPDLQQARYNFVESPTQSHAFSPQAFPNHPNFTGSFDGPATPPQQHWPYPPPEPSSSWRASPSDPSWQYSTAVLDAYSRNATLVHIRRHEFLMDAIPSPSPFPNFAMTQPDAAYPSLDMVGTSPAISSTLPPSPPSNEDQLMQPKSKPSRQIATSEFPEFPSTAEAIQTYTPESFSKTVLFKQFSTKESALNYIKEEAQRFGFTVLVRTSKPNYVVLICNCGRRLKKLPMERRRNRKFKTAMTGCEWRIIMFRSLEDSTKKEPGTHGQEGYFEFRLSSKMEHNHPLPVTAELAA
ncbi:hypothetical protein DFS34DRAFT_589546 [Phlyctochytrium arcticum]|nr:hypothetical protein DFS34DRAFT_589546 [Phlyctochytrium arcticum]